jgi:hypothetical protein
VEKFNTAAEKLAWENRGFLCWDANIYEADNLCISGYAVHEFNEIARRLSWSYVPKLLRLTAAQRYPEPKTLKRLSWSYVPELLRLTAAQRCPKPQTPSPKP